jgi:hypothetical protein
VGKVQHAATQAQQQQLPDTSVVVFIARRIVAGRLSSITKTLRQRQRGDDFEGLCQIAGFPDDFF